jgi:hypothetical protein
MYNGVITNKLGKFGFYVMKCYDDRGRLSLHSPYKIHFHGLREDGEDTQFTINGVLYKFSSLSQEMATLEVGGRNNCYNSFIRRADDIFGNPTDKARRIIYDEFDKSVKDVLSIPNLRELVQIGDARDRLKNVDRDIEKLNEKLTEAIDKRNTIVLELATLEQSAADTNIQLN